MGYKVKAAEVDVPPDDPFKNDRLDRLRTAEALSEFIGTIDGPCVVALDAEWGMGKTTFLRMWREDLCRNGVPVVMFNAWDNDFANEPFLALSEELREALGHYKGVAPEALETFTTAARDVLVNAVPALSGVAVSFVTGGVAGGVAEAVASRAMAHGEPDLSRYGKAKEAMSEFRKALETVAEAQAVVEDVRSPLVVLIDELDRCRPSYAVELLEVLKHLFAVKGVVFVLAVNRQQLEHSVRALYGTEFGAEIYLRRFFDIDLRLPDQDRDRFIDAQLEAIWAQLCDIHGIGADGWRKYSLIHEWMKRFFGSPEVDLRTVQQALQRLGLVLAMLGGDPGAVMLTTTFALILRTRDRDLYDRFVRGAASDEEVTERVRGWTDDDFFTTGGGHNFEASIILAAMECPLDSHAGIVEERSKLYRQYSKRRQSGQPDEMDQRIVPVLNFVDAILKHMRQGDTRPSFREAVTRLELVSGDRRMGLD